MKGPGGTVSAGVSASTWTFGTRAFPYIAGIPVRMEGFEVPGGNGGHHGG